MTSQPTARAVGREWWAQRLLVVFALACAAVVVRPLVLPSKTDRLLHEAAKRFSAEKYSEAEQLAKEVLALNAKSSLALLIAGEAAIRQNDTEGAIRYFRQVEDDGSVDAAHAFYRAGDRLVTVGRVREAEQYLRRAVAIDPNYAKANQRLSWLLQVQGRSWESAPFLRRILLDGHNARDVLVMAGTVDSTFVEDPQLIADSLKAEPEYQVVLVGQARKELTRSASEEAERLVEVVLASHPEMLEAQARLGRLLVERSADAEFLAWRKRLPRGWESHPDIWHAQGIWLRRNGQKPAAIRCFLEAARLDPNHKGAVLQLSQLLDKAKYPEITEQLAVRSQRLSQLHYLLMEVRFGYNPDLVRMVVDILDSLDRPLEAIGWCQVLEQWELGHHEWARERELQLHSRLKPQSEWTSPEACLACRIDPREFPTPHWPETVQTRSEKQTTAPQAGVIHFADVASEAGIEFQYTNGTTATEGLHHIIQATGGGIGVVDFDLDGWPDLYFAQSSPFPIQAGQTQYLDRMYRNLGNGRFADVTEGTRVLDAEYGQGVAVGDYNNDGFPDLFVANFGGNRLYENLGDGTFRDATAQAGVSEDCWTTSCLFADLNQDSLPEIFAVTYSPKELVLSLKCEYEGRPRTCAPTLLAADQDLLYRNQGDGRFENISEGSGILAPDGKGLAAVAADFEERGALDLFVANDTSANFFFRNAAQGGAGLMFKEQAISLGLAFDDDGNPQACMGLAAGDSNGDGRLDLFVTNFYGESNTLYSQNDDHSFTDAARSANLRNSSLNMLGFGTQFIDGELDGWPDLIITNGHIDFSFAHGNPDRMPPQYLRNLGDGRYEELTAASLGPYFQGRYFGRALAKLDWNRDGLEDVCVSHLDAPTALLTNTTATTGRFLALTLCGVQSNRDAVGAIVTVEAGGRRLVQHAVGGGGYLVSNQRQLLFGLADAKSVDRLTVKWPSGLTQSWEQLTTNQELIAVEGNSPLVARPSARR